MLTLTLTTTLLAFLLGLRLRERFAPYRVQQLNRCNYLLLQLLLLGLFAVSGWEPRLLPLLLTGVALQLLPALIGAWYYRQGADGSAWVIFSTYGGGNRGVLLLTLTYPVALHDFMVVDLGNFLSLALLLPLLLRWAGVGGAQPEHWHKLLAPLLIPLAAIGAGLLLRATPLAEGVMVQFNELVKLLLGAGVALYLGLQFPRHGLTLGPLLSDLLRVRLTSLLLVGSLVAALFTLSGTPLEGTTLVALLLFLLLPVSSLLPTLCAESGLAAEATRAVVNSSVLFLLLLPPALLLGLWLSG